MNVLVAGRYTGSRVVCHLPVQHGVYLSEHSLHRLHLLLIPRRQLLQTYQEVQPEISQKDLVLNNLKNKDGHKYITKFKENVIFS